MKTLNPLLAGKRESLVWAHGVSFITILIGHWIIAAIYITFGAGDSWRVSMVSLMATAGVTFFPVAIVYGRLIEERAPKLGMWLKPVNLIILACCFSPAIIILLTVGEEFATVYATLCSVLAAWMALLAYPHALHHLTRPLHRFRSLQRLARREVQPLLWIVLWSMPLFGTFFVAVDKLNAYYGTILTALVLSLVVPLSLYNRAVLPYAPPSAQWERRSRIAREIYLWLLWGLLAVMTVVTAGSAAPLLLAWTFVLVYRSRREFRRAVEWIARKPLPAASPAARVRVPSYWKVGFIGLTGLGIVSLGLIIIPTAIFGIQSALDDPITGETYNRTISRGPSLILNVHNPSIEVVVAIDASVDRSHEHDPERGIVFLRTYGEYVGNRQLVEDKLKTRISAISASLINGELLPDVNGDGFQDLIAMGTRIDSQGEREAAYYLIESTGRHSFSSEAEPIGASPYIAVPDYYLEENRIMVSNFGPHSESDNFELYRVAYALDEDEGGDACTRLTHLGSDLLSEESVNPLREKHFPVGLGNCYETLNKGGDSG